MIRVHRGLQSSKYAFTSLNSFNNFGGFTIVELLVVIVVIGILAAITVVSYTGITNQAVFASLQSDLDNSSKQLKVFQTINGSYPATISIDCATNPDTTTNKCLRLSSGNVITSLTDDYSVNNTTSPQTFNLTIKNSSTNIIGVVTDSSSPTVLTPAPLSPVADWLATYQGDHYGNFYDSVSKTYATVTRASTKTIYDPSTQHIYDVPANYLGVTPRSDGKGGEEAAVEEARTNLITNSYGSANSGTQWTSWNHYASNLGGTRVFSIVPGPYGTTAQRVQYTGNAGDGASPHLYSEKYTSVGSFVAGDNATFSAYVKGYTEGSTVARLYIEARDAASVLLGTQYSNISLGSDWGRRSVTYSNLPVNTSRLRLYILAIPFGVGNNVDLSFTAMQVEKGVFATSYIPTTATTVTRNADNVTVPTTTWNAASGTYMVSTAPTNASGQNAALIDWIEAGGNNRVTFYRPSASLTSYNGRLRSAGGSTMYPSSSAVSGYTVGGLKWDTGSTDVAYTNGSPGTDGGGLSSTPTGLPATAVIGPYNGPIQRVVVYSSALSGANITTVTNAIKDGP